MIEALVDPDTGDVIVVKPLGSVWGRCEVNAVVKLDDSELEKALVGQEHVVYPYAALKNTQTTTAMLEKSVVKVAVTDAAAMKKISAKAGTLRKSDADKSQPDATISNVLTPIAKDGGIVTLPDRPLPKKTAVVVEPL